MLKLPRVLLYLYFTLTDSKAQSLGVVCNSAEEVVRTVRDQERRGNAIDAIFKS